MTYKIELPYEKLLLLDGKVDKEAQDIIDKAKEEMKIALDNQRAREIIQESLENGTLSWRWDSKARWCPNCYRSAGYAKYKRNSKYHNKGEVNRDKPLYFRGVKFNSGFIHFQGSIDFCNKCVEKYDIINKIVNYVLDNDLKVEIKSGKTKYKKDGVRTCYECEKEMYESEMGESRRLMSNTYYKSTCPHCGAKAALFGPYHEITSKFRMIEAEDDE